VALRTVGVRLQAEVSGYVNNMRNAGKSTKDFVGELDKSARAGQLDAVADQAGRMGLGMVAAFGIAVGAAAKFDKQMSEVAAVSGATGAELEELRDAALEAGKATAFSATEAAKAQAELAKAGLSTSEILGGALSGSLSLAAAGSLDLAEAADIAAKAMNIFDLEGKDVGHVADVLAAAANKSATDVHEMGEALKMGGLASKAAGMSFEETSGTLAAFADNALNGSDAGTSLKTMLMMIQAPTDKAAGLMEELGIRAYDVTGQFVGTAELAGQLQERLGTLTQEQRNAALATIFGADAMRAANVLYNIGEQGIRDYTAAVDDEGAAADVARLKMDNLAGDVEKLTGSLETMAIEAGSGANGGLRQLVQMTNALVDQIATLPPAVGSTATILVGLSGAALLVGAGMVKVRRGTADALAELRQVGPTGVRAARGLEVTSKWAGRAAVAFIALQVASAALSSVVGKDLNPQVDALGKGLASWGKDGRLAGEAARVLGADMEDLGHGLKFLADTDNSRRVWARRLQDSLETVVPSLDATNTSLAKTRERVSAMDMALAQLVQGGSATEAAAAFDRLAEMAAKDGVSIEELKAMFPEYAAALEVAAGATDKTTGAIGEVGVAADEAAKQVQELKEAFDALFGIQMSLDRATIAYRESIVETTAELKAGKMTLNTNTEEGRANASAMLDQVDAAKKLRDANIDNGMAVEEANAKYQEQIAGLIALAVKLGFNEQAVRELLGVYEEIPDKVDTQIGTPGLPGATQRVETFNQTIRNVPPSKNVPFHTNAPEAKAAVEALRVKIAQIKSKNIQISAQVYWTSSGDFHVPGGTLVKNRWGGLYEHAAEGKLREAHIASPMGPARYAYAEPQTGGEAFIPKYGDRDRSLGILDKAASWYGMQVGSPDRPVWHGMTGGGTVTQRHVVDLKLNGDTVAELVFGGPGGRMSPRAERAIARGFTSAIHAVGGDASAMRIGRGRAG
jgi:TP901 family phage tail tape measure protein